jgi:TRAP-type mannitol/chloroaromatic compound transport system substrate-binding protein
MSIIKVNQEKLSKIVNQKRIDEITKELENIDRKAVRPLRALMAKIDEQDNVSRIQELEQQAIELRLELELLKR